ncbi:DinB family protein [Amphritea japonica]|nr:DinB family protein [Amphritea japonica]
MADYNQRMNDQVYTASSKLDSDQLGADSGAFFSSILGTLNHILVGDLLWLSRFSLHSARYHSLKGLSALPRPKHLNEILYPELVLLVKARNFVDGTINQWLNEEIREDDFARGLVYANSQGVVSERNFGELLSHFFNHQTHHRGQVSTLLYQHDIDIGCTDFLIDIPDVIKD